MLLDVKANFESVQAMFRQFPDAVKAAAVSALNKTARQAKTQIYKRIRSRRLLTTSAAQIKSAIHVRTASKYHLTSSVFLSGRPIPLDQFKTRQRKGGISVDVVGTGLKGPLMKYGNKAFTNPALAGGHGIFVRTSSRRLPIEKLFGPSLPSAITAQGWTEEVLKVEMAETWARTFAHEVEWRLSRFTK